MTLTIPLSITLLGAAVQLLNSGCIGLREILLSPDRPNYPNARRRLRVAMFILSAALLFHGVDQIQQAFAHPPRLSRPAGLFLSTAWLCCSALELERVTRQWLPARIQRRIQQLMHIASCKAARDMRAARRSAADAVYGPTSPAAPVSAVGPALAALAADGAFVAGPMEGPDVFGH